jgi:hypothetical protein
MFSSSRHPEVIIIIIIFNCKWVDTRRQQYSAHLHTNTEYTERNIHNNKKEKKNKTVKNLGSAGRAPSLRVIPGYLHYN